ncbi:DUF4352 domain-containing protein [Actinopolyspora erythraea]|uniref:DUF4352 domain-containing protein n=1 Tax=Actinopolyspora erythraea TaxID=414996 RepID=A0A099D465_9ACTN|nr:DUF4190 domain-containing protein [Actinopolyspora erythraea]ASU79347.1 DUF4352 domain-containing protein [Actinopolyspora erythraea]KGI80844.1 hypothetical protein IL38_14970 [Actinopolyspora erythraea]
MTYTPVPPQQRSGKFSGLAVASLVLGIIGVCGSIIPILNNLTAVAAFVGIVLGAIALFGTRKVMAGIGTGLGVLAIVLTVVIQAVLVSSIESGSGTTDAANEAPERSVQPTPTSNGSPDARSGSPQGESAESGSSDSPEKLGFGDKHTWRGGETISVSQPSPYTESNQFLQPEAGKRYVQFDVHVVNNGDDEYNVASVSITAQHAGKVAQQNYAAGDQLPNTQLPPGGDVTYTMVFTISEEPGELQVSVQPNAFAANTVYFAGEV